MKLSAPMLRVLDHLHRGEPVWAHCKKQADYGGLESTIRALVKRGLMTWAHELTPLGKRTILGLKPPAEL